MSQHLLQNVTALALLALAGSSYAQVHHSAHEPKSSPNSNAQQPRPCVAAKHCAGRTPPATMLELDDFISAHFEALHEQSAETPMVAAPAKPQG